MAIENSKQSLQDKLETDTQHLEKDKILKKEFSLRSCTQADGGSYQHMEGYYDH